MLSYLGRCGRYQLRVVIRKYDFKLDLNLRTYLGTYVRLRLRLDLGSARAWHGTSAKSSTMPMLVLSASDRTGVSSLVTSEVRISVPDYSIFSEQLLDCWAMHNVTAAIRVIPAQSVYRLVC